MGFVPGDGISNFDFMFSSRQSVTDVAFSGLFRFFFLGADGAVSAAFTSAKDGGVVAVELPDDWDIICPCPSTVGGIIVSTPLVGVVVIAFA